MGAEFVVNSLEEMCDLMCNNYIPEGEDMERVICDVQVYANELVERLIRLKDANKSNLTRNEIDTINDACNLIDHNREVLQEI